MFIIIILYCTQRRPKSKTKIIVESIRYHGKIKFQLSINNRDILASLATAHTLPAYGTRRSTEEFPATFMAEASEVYAPKTLQVWRTLLNWLAFFFQIFVQIIRGTPSLTQLFSFLSPPSPQFKPLPVVELPESAEAPPSAAVAAPRIDAGSVGNGVDENCLPRLTV